MLWLEFNLYKNLFTNCLIHISVLSPYCRMAHQRIPNCIALGHGDHYALQFFTDKPEFRFWQTHIPGVSPAEFGVHLL